MDHPDEKAGGSVKTNNEHKAWRLGILPRRKSMEETMFTPDSTPSIPDIVGSWELYPKNRDKGLRRRQRVLDRYAERRHTDAWW
jgi:hypothetical protein